MKHSRSRTEEELELEFEMMIQTRNLDNLMKKISRTPGRKKLQPIIKEIGQAQEQFNSLFVKYKKSMLSKGKED